MKTPAILLCALLGFTFPGSEVHGAGEIQVSKRLRIESPPGSGQYQIEERKEAWSAAETAVIVCDMWDAHHCFNAVGRVTELAPRLDDFITEARRRGALIVHAPSDCMESYSGDPARVRAQQAPKASNLPPDIEKWLYWIDEREEKAGYPIDHTDGGEDDDPKEHAAWAAKLTERGRNPAAPWQRQIERLAIDQEKDAITDSGVENWNLLEARGIKNVIVTGVHTNMCVLGRPFGLRQMAKNGKNVVLARDLTDTMYNPAMPPKVSHFSGTDLIIEHVEKYVCPTITSDQLLGGKAFVFAKDTRPRVLMLVSEPEYETEKTLPEFARTHLAKDFKFDFAREDPKDENGFVGLEAMEGADLLLVSVRRRSPPVEQMDAMRKFVAAGKPVIGIRTASHAFSLRGKEPPEGHATWDEWDAEIFGGNYRGHHGATIKTFAKAVPAAEKHPILSGVSAEEFATGGSLYQVSPLKEGTEVLLMGRAEGIAEPEPVAWTHRTAADGRVFYTSLGHREDFGNAAFVTMLRNAVSWALDLPVPPAEKEGAWRRMNVPGTWEDQGEDHDGLAWYRCRVTFPESWGEGATLLDIGEIDNACEVFVNGERAATLGAMPPAYRNGLAERESIPINAVGAELSVAVRIYGEGGRGGFKGGAPRLLHGDDAIVLAGEWDWRAGDAGKGALERAGPVFAAVTTTRHSDHETTDQPRSPEDSSRLLRTAPDLEADLILSDPLVSQPLHISFDARGRLWLVEYRQYPNPAGLRQMSRDNVWRTVYDRKPPPPPHATDSPFRGRDRISIHEDADGDGTYESHQVFVDGLNIATSVAHGRGGVWVTNPPYLLFYPDRDGDDVPDSDPEVRLEGFGLEDTHSVANSLVFGPDGWLYGAQGSTVSAAIVRPGIDKPEDAVRTMGQNIWRYHPERGLYEVFAEGGGNAYGVEIDSKGRIYSGHNGGDTRGFHYVEGGYYQKSFNKHGDHSNPYTYGYLPPMRNAAVARFIHQFVIYESEALPASYHGKLIGVDVLHNNLVRSEVLPDGSTFRTVDLDRPISSEDTWFRPVMVADGPDGNLYLADWYDKQVNHYRNHEGQIDHAMGRVYRVRAKGSRPGKMPDLLAASDDALSGYLASPNRWQRRTALRLLSERQPAEILDLLASKESLSLEELWLLSQCGQWNSELGSRALRSPDPSIRMWAIVLAESGTNAPELSAMAATDSSPEVLSHLATAARRLSAEAALPVLSALMTRDEHASDPHLPLLCWWGIEARCEHAAEAVLALFGDPSFWSHPIVRETVAPRLMRRFAAMGEAEGWERCAGLFALCPSGATREKLMAGFEEATKGRALTGFPEALLEELAKSDGNPALIIRMRRGDEAALKTALESEAPSVIEAFGAIEYSACVPVLLDRFRRSRDEAVRRACLSALGQYGEETIGRSLVEAFPALDGNMKEAVASILSGRASWFRALLDAVESGEIDPAVIPLPVARKVDSLGNAELADRARRIWPTVETPGEAEIARIARVVGEGDGMPKRGEAIFTQRCAGCHLLFGKGGSVGPDLTSYQRDDLSNLLLSIVNPGAEIREGYENRLVTLKDGSVQGGFLAGQDAATVMLRDFAGQLNVIPRDRIASIRDLGTSLMPPGLLAGLDDGTLRDFVAYLRSTTPPF